MIIKKAKIYQIVFLFVLSFIWHFGYDKIPCFITSIFFPVNESVWEHMKIIYGVILISYFFEKYLLNKYHVSYNNLLVETVLKSILGIIFYLLIYFLVFLKEGLI